MAIKKSVEELVQAYCQKFSIPFDYFFEILNDTKVIPMIRGKGTEYNVYLFGSMVFVVGVSIMLSYD